LEQLGELQKVADAFGYVEQQHQPGVERRERNGMTETALRELIRQKIGEAVAKARPTGGSNMNKNHFKALAAFHKSSAGHHKEKSERSTQIAKCFKSMGVPALEKLFNDDGRAEQCRMEQHNEAAAHWSRMNATVGHDDETAESAKMGKGSGDDFWDRFYATPRQSPSGGLFSPSSAAGAELIKTDQSPSGGLF
jgi:hypothetical protein